MILSRRLRILVLFGLVVVFVVLVSWAALGQRSGSPESADRLTLLPLALFLVLILVLAAARVRAEQFERRQAEQQWQVQAAELHARERKRNEELGVAVNTLQQRFAQSQRLEEALRDDITARRRTEAQLREYAERLELLSRKLLEAQEMERRRVARELHDEIGQVLTAVKINLQAMQRSVAPDLPLPRLQESVDIVDRALQQVRNLSLELRPAMLDDLGLVAAVRWYVDRQASRAGLQRHFVAEPPDISVPPEVATACFRIAQEAITNILRHAQAKQINVEIRLDDRELRLSVRDDGKGFPVADARRRAAKGGCLGMLGMEERAHLLGGRMEIRSVPGQGTEIAVRFLLPPRRPGG
jgi:signal transduction histidine kinase